MADRYERLDLAAGAVFKDEHVAWLEDGIQAAMETDMTLTRADYPANAMIVGKALDELDANLAAQQESLSAEDAALRELITALQGENSSLRAALGEKASILQDVANANLFWQVGADGKLTFSEIRVDTSLVVDELPEVGDPLLNYYLKVVENNTTYYVFYRWYEENWIRINDENIFLEELITRLQNLETTTGTHTSQLATLDTQVGTAINNVSAMEGRVGMLEESAVTYELEYKDNMLTFYSVKGEGDTAEKTQIGASYKIVSAAEAGVSSVITITRKTANVFSTVLANVGTIDYNFKSEDSEGFPTGDATATWAVNGAQVLVEQIPQGDNSFPLHKYITTAGEYSVLLTIKDSIGTVKTLRWSANVIDMYIDCSLNDKGTFDGDVTVRYTPYGLVEKTVYFEFNGDSDYFSEVVATSGIGRSLVIPHQPHGAYSLKVYCTATINNQLISSPALYYDIMFTDVGVTTPIIRWPYSGDNLNQYTNTSFKYSVYTPGSLNSDIELYIDGALQSRQTVNQDEQTWDYRPMDFGPRTLMIKCGEVEKVKYLTVDKFPYDVAPITEALQFDFDPTGRTNGDENYDSFEYNGYTMTLSEGFDWNNGGWKTDSQGASYFCIKAGDRATFNYPLFGDDARQLGKNFKLIYKATNCRAFKAGVMDCITETTIEVDKKDENGEVMYDEEGNPIKETKTAYIGVNVNAQEAKIYGATAELEIPYVEDKEIELEFNIEADPNNGGNNLMVALIDSDPSRAINYDVNTAIFNQAAVTDDAKPIPIVFGSDECDVWIYRFKAYNAALSDLEIMKNYIADSLTAEEMLARYERNDILNSATGELDYTKLSALYPDLRIILITCPRFTNDKSDKVKKCTVQQIMGNGDAAHNWTATDVQVKGQGTSSNEYGTSARNIDIKCNAIGEGDDAYAFTYADGSTSKKYAMTDKSVAVNYFNIKVNVASSESANNARLAQRYHQFNPYIRQARLDNPKVRDTMEFHPCVIFIKETGVDSKGEAQLPQEFPADGQFHFYACGDFGNSKKNSAAMGMDENNLKECIVEISNNTQAQCKFKLPAGWDELLPDEDPTGGGLDIWGGDIVEFRYPEDLLDIIADEDNEYSEEEEAAAQAHLEILKAQTRRLWNWVNSTDRDAATNAELPESVTYGSTTYTTDSKEYRLAKFVNEYADYFIEDSLLFNYLFTERYLMIDNRAKNVFIHTSDGIHWDFCFDYDNDTSLGCDNMGDLKYDYGLEDVDINSAGSPVYNAHDSVLWCNVRDGLKSNLKSMFQRIETAGCFSAANLCEDFKNYQWMKPERLQMIDMRRKYLRPYTDGHYRTNLDKDPTGQTVVQIPRYLSMLNGRKTYQRERFEKYMEPYMASKYISAVAKRNLMSFRIYSPANGGMTPGTILKITPYSDLYVTVDFDAIEVSQRCRAGEIAEISTPNGQPLHDTNTRVYCANLIQDLGDLAPFFLGSADFAQGTKLSTLKLGSNISGYRNAHLEKLTLEANPLLETIDIRNCVGLENAIDLSGCEGLKTIYSTGSSLPGVTFANGGLLENAYLNEVQSLVMRNLKNLETMQLSSGAALTKLWIENCETIDTKAIIESAINLKQVRLIGIDWNFGPTGYTVLNPVIKMTGIDAQGYDIIYDGSNNGHRGSFVQGDAHYDLIPESYLTTYPAIWPELSISFTEKIPQYPVTFVDWDGTELLTVYIDYGKKPVSNDVNTATDPIAVGMIQTPTRETTVSTIYTFSGWDADLDVIVTGPLTYTAQYSEETRNYTVTWKSQGAIVDTQSVPYGSSAVYAGDELTIVKDPVLTKWDIFKRWDISTGNITADTEVNAIWYNGLPPAVADVDLTENLNPAQIYTILNSNRAGEYFEPGDRISIEMGAYPEFGNIEHIDVIDKPTTFDGETYIESEVQLLAEDEDWTLVFDGYFDSAVHESVLMSCYQNQYTNGLRIMYTYQNQTTSNHGPAVKWGNAWGLFCGQSTTYVRIVLRHKKGDTGIYSYYSNPFKETSETYIPKATATKTNQKIGFGAFKDIDGTISNYAKGAVMGCRVWRGDLGAEMCAEMALWPHDFYKFNVTNNPGLTNFYYEDTAMTKPTNLDLISEGSIDYRGYGIVWGKSTNTNFFDSNIYAYLQRFVNAFPKEWRLLLKKPYIRTTDSAAVSNNYITEQPTEIWTLAHQEVSSKLLAEPYSQEDTYKKNGLIRRGFGYTKEPYSAATLLSQDWVHVSTTDPVLTEGNTVEEGHVWLTSDTQTTGKIRHLGRWVAWSDNYAWTRTTNYSNPSQAYLWNHAFIDKTRGYNYLIPCIAM